MSNQIKHPIWTKDFIFNFVISFFIFLSMYLLLVTVGGYSKETFHVSDSLETSIRTIYCGFFSW